MQFKSFLEQHQWNANRLPYILKGLRAEAIKAGSFENFRKDFSMQIKHGLYWHLTDNPNFIIDSEKGPRDMSSLANGGMDKGKLMITSHLDYWAAEYDTRQFVAIIDMSEVPRDKYWQVNRGFGNEFFVGDPSKAKVYKVLNLKQAFQFDKSQSKYLPNSEEMLEKFYQFATAA